LDFAIYCTGTGTGLIYIYESGVLAAAFGAYAATDYLAITYDGATITYWQNSRSLRAVAIAGKTFFATSAFFDPGAACNSLEFGPSAVVPLLDTPQLGVNAASVMTSAQSAATVVNTGVHSTLEDKDMISVTVTTSGFPVAIDAACSALIFTASGSSMSVANLKIYRDGAPVAGAVWDPTNGGTIAVGFATMPQGAQVTLTVTDTPAAGTHTYTLHSQCTLQFASSGSGNIQTSNNFIKVREIKK
jgi:hypothetical protein